MANCYILNNGENKAEIFYIIHYIVAWEGVVIRKSFETLSQFWNFGIWILLKSTERLLGAEHLNKWGDIDDGKEKLASVTFFSFENWMTNMTWSNPTILLLYYASFWWCTLERGSQKFEICLNYYIKWWYWHANFSLVFQCLSCYVNFRSILDA